MSKKVDVSFMKMVNSDDEWQREVKDAGSKLLCIIDVYTVIWGPCEMLAGHFSNTYFDLGEKYGMRFVRATADNITDLKEKYLGSSEPRFLFYLDGGGNRERAGVEYPGDHGHHNDKIAAAVMTEPDLCGESVVCMWSVGWDILETRDTSAYEWLSARHYIASRSA
eukprot:CAMPEP_0174717130 /NCGR_PEP_ID=MMETSP1094-20130205/25954_1 /TAXON_ID=156173 /ORGANISM="Chrysochromulina brevifilum, Strain UTEX LB 985" /LENGTH=165 /DNA_ID=CAMNT_0015917023 /DNA_START=53 /DNA_END=549 /DNA_ORIENTATION=-